MALLGKTSLEGNKNGNGSFTGDHKGVRNDSYRDVHATQKVSPVEIVDTQFVDLNKVLDRNLLLYNYDDTGCNNKCEMVDYFRQGPAMDKST